MKTTFKCFILLSVFLMIVPAYAIEHQLGGSLRVRALTAGDWTANDNDKSEDRSVVDSRSMLSYTAKINKDFAVYTIFRINNTVYGGADDPARAGIHNVTLQLKSSYIDFNVNNVNVTVGKQSFFEARGLLLNDVAPGLRVRCPLTDQFSLDAKWIKFGEGGTGDTAHQDLDTFAFTPVIKINENIKFKPYFWYATSRGMDSAERTWNCWYSDFRSKIPDPNDPTKDIDIGNFTDLDMYYVGFDFDATMDNTSVWFTALYQTGSADVNKAATNRPAEWGAETGSLDFTGLAALGGGSITLGKTTLSGQLFYASGDDVEKGKKNDEIDRFITAEAGYYYWSEIMGLGSNDDCLVKNTGWSLSNIMGGGVSASVAASPKLTLNFSLWYAATVEDMVKDTYTVEADALGTEVNAGLDYSIMDNLTLSLLGAYIMAGDAMTEENAEGSGVKDGANPFYVHSQIKASF